MKPLILLDIDGVLNPHVLPDQGEGPELILSDHRLALVRRLGACGCIAWVSTWSSDIVARMESQLQLPSEPLRVSLVIRPNDRQEPTPKLRSISRWLARMQASKESTWDSVVWIDDVLGPDAEEWARGHDKPVLLLKPMAAIGLTPAHIADIEAFTYRDTRNQV